MHRTVQSQRDLLYITDVAHSRPHQGGRELPSSLSIDGSGSGGSCQGLWMVPRISASYRLKAWHHSRDLGKRHCSSCLPVGVAAGLGAHPLRAWGNVETLWRNGTHEASDLPAPSRSPPKSHFSAHWIPILSLRDQRAYSRGFACALTSTGTASAPGALRSVRESTRVPRRSLVKLPRIQAWSGKSTASPLPTATVRPWRDSHAQITRLSHRKLATLQA